MGKLMTRKTTDGKWVPAPDRDLDSTLRRLVDRVGVDRVRFELWRIEQEIERNKVKEEILDREEMS